MVSSGFLMPSESDPNSLLWTPKFYRIWCPSPHNFSPIYLFLLSKSHSLQPSIPGRSQTQAEVKFLYLLFLLRRIFFSKLLPKLVLPQTPY
jgi:hypothetical protein